MRKSFKFLILFLVVAIPLAWAAIDHVIRSDKIKFGITSTGLDKTLEFDIGSAPNNPYLEYNVTNSRIEISNDGSTVFKVGSNDLVNSQLLTSVPFPDTVGLYGWNTNETTWSNGGLWIGGESLSQAGTIGLGQNHLGVSGLRVDLDGVGNAYYSAGTAFDTANESFTAGAWYRFDTTGAQMSLIGKYNSSTTERSFYLNFTGSSKKLEARMYYTNALLVESTIEVGSVFSDSKPHHIIFQYEASQGSVRIFIDGKVRMDFRDANIVNTRFNPAAAKLSFGANNASGSTIHEFDGQISDPFYRKSVLTHEEIREIMVYGSGYQAYIDHQSKVRINGETGDKGWYEIRPSDITGLNNTSFAAVSGWTMKLPSDSFYRLHIKHEFLVNDDNDDGDFGAYSDLYNVTTSSVISQTNAGQIILQQQSTGDTSDQRVRVNQYYTSKPIFLNKEDEIVLRARSESAADNYEVSEGEFWWELLD